MYELWLPELAPSEQLRRAFKHGKGFSGTSSSGGSGRRCGRWSAST